MHFPLCKVAVLCFYEERGSGNLPIIENKPSNDIFRLRSQLIEEGIMAVFITDQIIKIDILENFCCIINLIIISK